MLSNRALWIAIVLFVIGVCGAGSTPQQCFAAGNVSIKGYVTPPQAEAVPLARTKWNVRVLLTVQTDNFGRRKVKRSWEVTASRDGSFFFDHIAYNDLWNARYEVTVLGGWAYYDTTRSVSANTPNRHTLEFSMVRKK